MRNLRKTWERVYKEALILLERAKHPIAEYTLEIINKGILKIFPYHKMQKRDFNEYRKQYNNLAKEKIPNRFPPAKSVFKKFSTEWSAKILEDRVSIDDSITEPKKIAEILVHEANHFLNCSYDHYDSEQQIFEEELRAEVAEILVFSRLTRYKLAETAKSVSESYQVPLPKIVTFPEGLFVPLKKG